MAIMQINQFIELVSPLGKFYQNYLRYNAQKMKFLAKDFSSKCDQILKKLRIWSQLLKISLFENFIFCAVLLSLFIKLCYHEFLIKDFQCNDNFLAASAIQLSFKVFSFYLTRRKMTNFFVNDQFFADYFFLPAMIFYREIFLATVFSTNRSIQYFLL